MVSAQEWNTATTVTVVIIIPATHCFYHSALRELICSASLPERSSAFMTCDEFEVRVNLEPS